jgi:DNA-binding IclR family transcriptional regulator
MTIQMGTIQSVSRALRVLECIASSPRSLSAGDISSEVDLALPTIYHILKTLEVDGYIGRNRGMVTLTAKLGQLNAAAESRMALDPLTIDTMHAISLATGETVYTSRWLHGDVVVEGVAESDQAVRVAGIYVGLRGHAYARASGRVLLAFGPRTRWSYLRTVDLVPLTPNTLTDVGLIEAELQHVAERGYAVDITEFTAGVCCLSLPVWGSDGVCRAATVSVPEARFAGNFDRLLTLMRNTISSVGLSRSA